MIQRQEADIGGQGFDFFQTQGDVQDSKNYPSNLQFNFNIAGTGQRAKFKMMRQSQVGDLFRQCQKKANDPIQTIQWYTGPLLFKAADQRRRIKTLIDQNTQKIPTDGKIELTITYKAVGGQKNKKKRLIASAV